MNLPLEREARSRRGIRLKLFQAMAIVAGAALCGCGSHNSPAPAGPYPYAGATNLVISPNPVSLSLTAGASPAHQTFAAHATLNGATVDVSSAVFFYLDDTTIGTMNGPVFTSAADQGGSTLLHANLVTGAETFITAQANLNILFTATVTTACPGCPAIPTSLPTCGTSSAGGLSLVYPPDGVLLPPNMGVIDSHFYPGTNNKYFEVTFTNAVTDVRAETKCNPINDTRGNPTGGCDYSVDPVTWAYVANSNRGGDPVKLSILAVSSNMTCVSASNSHELNFATEDLNGGIYYWQSAVVGTSGSIPTPGKAGGIFRHDFSQPNAIAEPFLNNAGANLCYGCHFLSRDGLRMSVAQDDADSDDEFSDVTVNLLTFVGSNGTIVAKGLAAGSQVFSPDDSKLLASDGLGNLAATGFNLYDGALGSTLTPLTVPGIRSTQPDWSQDSTEIYYVVPTEMFSWTNTSNGESHKDDTHFSGGTLWKVSYDQLTGDFGTPMVVVSNNNPALENDYYPAISPDGGFLLYDRAIATTNDVAALDDYNNPAARLTALYVGSSGQGQPVDLVNANGGTAPLTNSWPRWSPFVQTYKGELILWMTFSSTRNYGLVVNNQDITAAQGGPLVNCYPPDTPEEPNESHQTPYPPDCNQPQIWMAAVSLSALQSGEVDPSFPAFWLPFQDVSAHNHIAQWVSQIGGGTE